MSAVRRVAVLAVLLLSLVPVGPVAQAGTTPAVFEVVTTAVGVVASSTQRPAQSVVTGGLVDSTIGYASSALSSAGASASAAAAVYPGDLVATGPALLCSQFLPCPLTPPAYPLLAQASYPERPSASADSPAPVGAARALAGEQSTDGSAQVSKATVPGAPVTVSVGAQVTTTRAWVDTAGAHVRSRSDLHNVVIGPLEVGSLRVTDDVDVPPDGRPTDRTQVAVADVTVAGQAASIDDQGVHVLGVHQAAAVPALTQQGLDVRLIGTDRADAVGAARSTAGGLRVTVSVPVRGVPAVVPGAPGANRTYLGTLVVGGVGAAVALGTADGPLLSALPPAAPSSLAAVLLPSRNVPGVAAGAALPGAMSPGGVAVAPAPLASRRRLLPDPDLRTVALMMAVVPPGLLLLWRGLVAVRRRPT
jgi:hypothetical protein